MYFLKKSRTNFLAVFFRAGQRLYVGLLCAEEEPGNEANISMCLDNISYRCSVCVPVVLLTLWLQAIIAISVH